MCLPQLVQLGETLEEYKQEIATMWRFVERLDPVPVKPEAKPEPNDTKPPATPAQPRQVAEIELPSEVVDLIGGGGWTGTSDLRIIIMSSDNVSPFRKDRYSASLGK